MNKETERLLTEARAENAKLVETVKKFVAAQNDLLNVLQKAVSRLDAEKNAEMQKPMTVSIFKACQVRMNAQMAHNIF